MYPGTFLDILDERMSSALDRVTRSATGVLAIPVDSVLCLFSTDATSETALVLGLAEVLDV